ncbi:hypothetical protein HDC90_004117 [Pedobacter sp. AK013]|uniref:hypothetical protein n=1 Tax=Pedobacter sp. AK013 TaxID=2723071 RepID=UPI001617286B|nr:hypothetical protein [Pedobacter sp. AK013]MBB6239464.1 hypothetical protein [Pedobacter sp. AK013]
MYCPKSTNLIGTNTSATGKMESRPTQTYNNRNLLSKSSTIIISHALPIISPSHFYFCHRSTERTENRQIDAPRYSTSNSSTGLS